MIHATRSVDEEISLHLVTDMNLDRWVERLYNESDIGRGIATTVAGTAGLTTYLYWDDWVVAAFVTIIVFPGVRILASTTESYRIQSRERSYSRGQIKELFKNLGSKEKAVVQAFVWHGDSVITWRECNELSYFSAAGIESLINRGLMHATVTAACKTLGGGMGFCRRVLFWGKI